MPLSFARSILAGGAAEPVYALSGFPSNTNEGSIVTFTLTTENVPEGTLVPYSITGISSSDISSGSLSSNFIIDDEGTASRTIGIRNDSLSEGTETLTISTAGLSENVAILDTSRTVSYSWWSVGDTTPNEGTTINVEARAYNTSENMYWYFTGINDVSAYQGQLTKTGPFTSGSDTYYKHKTSITFTADASTEGNESYNLYLRSNSTTGTIRATRSYTVQDTSLTPEAFTNASVVNIGTLPSTSRGTMTDWNRTGISVASGNTYGSYSPTRYAVYSYDISGSSILGNGTAFYELYNPNYSMGDRDQWGYYYVYTSGGSRKGTSPYTSANNYSPAFGSSSQSYTKPDSGFAWSTYGALNELGTQFFVKNAGYQGQIQVYKYTHGDASASWHVNFDYNSETGRNTPTFSNASLKIAVDRSTNSDKVYLTQDPKYYGNGMHLYTEVWDSSGYVDRWYHGITNDIKATHIVGDKFVYIDKFNNVYTVNRT